MSLRKGSDVKEGEDFPYCGFPEPIYIEDTQERLSGFEIFFETKWYWITTAWIDDEAINDEYWKERKEVRD